MSLSILCPVCSSNLTAAAETAEVTCTRCGSRLSAENGTIVGDSSPTQEENQTRAWDGQPVVEPPTNSDGETRAWDGIPIIDPMTPSPGSKSGSAGSQSARMPLPSDLPQIPGYELLDFIARGGMGFVLRARHKVLQRTVAIKMPLAGRLAGDQDRERFVREARSAARLNHPNICPIHEVGESDGRPYIVMGYVEGKTLGDWANETKPSARQAAEMVALLSRAVGYAHGQEVLHRDLKPSNVMVEKVSCQPVLMDFGLAKDLGDQQMSHLTHTGQVMGTPAYMAPEQAAGQSAQIGPRSDVYSLGAVLYDLLCGRPPFTGTVGEVLQRVQLDEPLPPRKLAPRLHRDLETICLKALAKNPAQRYATAQAFAEDLERFNAGEAILARRQSWVARVAHRARRSPVAAAALTGVVLSLSVVGVMSWKSSAERRLAGMTQAFDTALETDAWNAEHLTGLDGQLQAIQRAKPAQAVVSRERMHSRFAEVIAGQIQSPKLEPEDITRIENLLTLLEPRDAAAAAGHRESLGRRLRAWQPAFELSPPFSNLDAVFAGGTVKVQSDALIWPGGRLKSEIRCLGRVQFEAAFLPGWEDATELSLTLSVPSWAKERAGYLFVLSGEKLAALVDDTRAKKDAPQRKAFRAAAAEGSALWMAILRDNQVLRQEEVAMPRGTLRLVASHDEDRLAFQVNDLPPMLFQDLFPRVAGGSDSFGLEAPAKLRVKSLRASEQALPPAPSPLERGNDFYSRGKFAEALAEYRAQQIASSGELEQETRLKQGMCLAALNRDDEAAGLLERLAVEKGPRWPGAAGCHLWLLRLKQNRLDAADGVYETLASQYSFEQLAVLIPSDLRNRILAAYSRQAIGINVINVNPERVRNCERAIAIEEFISGGKASSWRLWDLLRAYHASGQMGLAMQFCQKHRPAYSGLQVTGGAHADLMMEYCWLMRLQGRSGEALNALNPWIYQTPGTFHPKFNCILLVERARLNASLNRWKEAEQDVDDLLRLATPEELRHNILDATLLQGFIREQRGDMAGAQESWERGLTHYPDPTAQFGFAFLHWIILSNLTGRLTDTQASQIVTIMANEAGGNKVAAAVNGLLKIPPAVLRNVFTSPRGRALAHKISLRSISFHEILQDMPAMFAYEFMRQGTFPKVATLEQEELIWKASGGFIQGYKTGKLGVAQIAQLMLTWKGNLSYLGWDGVAPTLEPSFRGTLAFLGARHLAQAKKPAEAALLFQKALADAPPGSPLRALIEAEIQGTKAE